MIRVSDFTQIIERAMLRTGKLRLSLDTKAAVLQWRGMLQFAQMKCGLKQGSPDSWPSAHGLQVAEYINMSCFIIKMWSRLLF